MQREKCLRTLAWALITAAAALALSGAARASSLRIIHQFELPQNPQGSLTFDAAGNLYGTTDFGGSTACSSFGPGCGVVWKLAPNGRLIILHQFTGGADGAFPDAGVIFDAAGNLYGTTFAGGDVTACPSHGGCGVVFKLAPNPDGTWTESVLHTFAGAPDGAVPEAGLILDATGNLYGTTFVGGDPTACPSFPGFPVGCGIVFELKPNPGGTWTESVLHVFTDADGANPFAGLIFDSAGNLYGTTRDGGASTACPGGCGVVFKLAPNSDGTWTESVIHSFTGTDGNTPFAGLTLDTTGDLYGTTLYGGSSSQCGSGCGVVYRLAPNPDGTWTESVLHTFAGGADGTLPNGLTFDAAGNLYGTTWGGGRHTTASGCFEGCGTVFKLTPTPSGWHETFWKFFGTVGENPLAPVIFDKKGNLYGTTYNGTGNSGVVFKITP